MWRLCALLAPDAEGRGPLIAQIVDGSRLVGDDARWRESARRRLTLPVPGLAELWRRCERYGGYRPDGRGGRIYDGFVAFAAAELGLRARGAAPLTVDELITAAGGHLVLVLDAADGQLCFHKPSGDAAGTQQHVWMDRERSDSLYADRGIAIELIRDPGMPTSHSQRR